MRMWRMKDAKIDKNIFEIGPAIDINAESLFGFSRFKGLNCTGFAHPKGIVGIPSALIKVSINNIVVPIGS